MTLRDKYFYQGFAVAIGTLARNGYPALAVDIMTCNGVTLAQLKEAESEEFDLVYLREELKEF